MLALTVVTYAAIDVTELAAFLWKSQTLQIIYCILIVIMALGVAKRSLPVKDANSKSSGRSRARSTTPAKTTKASSVPTAKKSAAAAKVATSAAKRKKASTPKATTPKKTTSKAGVKTKKATPKTTAPKSGKKTTKTTTTRTTTTRKAAAKSSTKKTKQPTPSALRVVSPQRTDSGKVALTKRDQLGHLLLEQILRNEGFRGVVSTEKHMLAEYSTDESIFSIAPQLVLQPLDVADVQIAARVVARETERFASLSLTPRAAGTGHSGGSLTDSVVIDIQASLTDISDITYRNKTNEALITAQAGVRWRDMAQRLARVGYHIPTYSTAHEICTVGGAVGNNAAGAEADRYGHCADYIESLEVVLHDGEVYQVTPLTYKQFQALVKKKNTLSNIVAHVFAVLEKSQKELKQNKLSTPHNTAGYNLWGVLPQGVAAFKKGTGTFDLTKLLAGSQGTIGIITSATLRAIPLPEALTLIAVPIFDLADVGKVVQTAKKLGAHQIEAFDDTTFDLAMQHPEFFKRHLHGLAYYRTMLMMYKTYHFRYQRRLPVFTLLVTFSEATTDKTPASTLAEKLTTSNAPARVIANPVEEAMLWHIRRASYDLSKLLDERKRPAAFLEDMLVPVEALPKFLTEVKKLWKEFNLQATMYGHIGNGHLQFYPLLDFTDKTTPALVEKMSERFFALATKHGGTMSAEHNDGIIRTPHLSKLYSKAMLHIFEQIEHIFDPSDIFNPGKKVHPRFEVREVLRQQN